MQFVMNYVTEKYQWDDILSKLCGNQILQSWDWGEFKSRHGWLPQRITWSDDTHCLAAAQILIRHERYFGMDAKIIYVPRGPVLDWTNMNLRETVLDSLRDIAISEDAIFIKLDPYVPVGYSVYSYSDVDSDHVGESFVKQLIQHGWQKSKQQIQFSNTMVLNLNVDNSDLLSNFSQKTRYNIRLASKKGLVVRNGSIDELDLIYDLYKLTANRNGFAIRSRLYYIDLWKSLMKLEMAQVLIVEMDDEMIGAVILSMFGGCATYLYGMSSGSHNEKMPNYLLQWEAMMRAKDSGCTLYDFWGVPDIFGEDDPLWGVWRFKSGFRGNVIYTIGAWDFVCKRFEYWLYANLMPKILSYVRMISN